LTPHLQSLVNSSKKSERIFVDWTRPIKGDLTHLAFGPRTASPHAPEKLMPTYVISRPDAGPVHPVVPPRPYSK
jgi:hypothetical protein